jgi:2,3-bisphosphoglycerate-independent phosphoglycerate mutase
MDLKKRSALVSKNDSKILLLVMDGLGGLPKDPGGPTELEAAGTPNLDDLAAKSICGLHVPVGPGVTPGSGPAHLGLFGYNPIEYDVGRGVLSALGTGHDLSPTEVAARGNFCTVDGQGLVTDRRAGRIPTEKTAELCDKIRDNVELQGASYRISPVKDYRFLLILEGEGLSGEVADTDPQATGKKPLDPAATAESGKKTAALVAQFVDKAARVIADEHPANHMLMRGFSMKPDWPDFEELFGVRAACAASYPMYRGVARLVGMELLSPCDNFEQEIRAVKDNWKDYDFFFVHFKPVDSAGEDGDFDRKVSLIEEFDKSVPDFMDLGPDVVVVTGDHSTPAVLKSHSWHPVPTLLWSRYCRPDGVSAFGDRDCVTGGLGPRFPAVDLMPLAMANALRLEKFGA